MDQVDNYSFWLSWIYKKFDFIEVILQTCKLTCRVFVIAIVNIVWIFKIFFISFILSIPYVVNCCVVVFCQLFLNISLVSFLTFHVLGVQLLALLVPTLISYLLDENAISSAPQVSKGLHDFALQNLMRIGPLYPSAFKVVIGAALELKTRLESAIRANQASSKAKAAARQAQPTVQAAPTIKLKTSFF